MNDYKQMSKFFNKKVYYKRIFNEENIQSFIKTIKDTSWENILNNADNPDNAFNEFSELFMTAFETNFPQTRIKSYINKEKSPWMTKCILKSVKKKNKLYKTFLKSPSRKKEKAYKIYKNRLNHVIKLSKKLYYEEQLVKYKNNSKMNNSSEKIDDPVEIANAFCSVVHKLCMNN